jgi:hypothetical protein
MLERAHGARIHVDVRVELHHRDLETAGFENGAERCGGDAFPNEETTPPVTNTNLVMREPADEEKNSDRRAGRLAEEMGTFLFLSGRAST